MDGTEILRLSNSKWICHRPKVVLKSDFPLMYVEAHKELEGKT